MIATVRPNTLEHIIICEFSELRVGSVGIDLENYSRMDYDSRGNVSTYVSCVNELYWIKRSYDSFDNVLTYTCSTGFWYKRTYDSSGIEKTYENSSGFRYGF